MAGATAAITCAGTDITNNVLFESTTFTTVARGELGQFEMRVKDPNNVFAFQTGQEVSFSLNGTKVFGGYITQIGRTFAFPTTTTGTKIWILRGADYNILFDKRVLRNTADYYTQLPSPPKDIKDGAAIKYVITNYTDFSGFDTSTIDDVDFYNSDGTSDYVAYPQQGSTVRDLIAEPAFKSGAVFYISADKKIHYHALETVTSSWGFSDSPNNSTTFKMKDVSATEDGSYMVNDALIWGGSPYAGATGGTVFSRVQSPSSQTAHGRWQYAEAKFGDREYGTYQQVNAKAKAIINGPGGADATNQLKGLMYPQWQMSFFWWLHDVPAIPVPGQLFTIELTSFGIAKILPLRSMTMTFPELDPQGKAYVLMQGDFNLSVRDPYSVFAYIRENSKRILTGVFGSANDDSLTTTYGAYGAFANKITSQGGLVYKLPFGYIPATLLVFDGALALAPGIGFNETDAVNGTFTLTSAPTGALYATCRTLHS